MGGSVEEEFKYSLVKWSIYKLPIGKGGKGIKYLVSFNKAPLGK